MLSMQKVQIRSWIPLWWNEASLLTFTHPVPNYLKYLKYPLYPYPPDDLCPVKPQGQLCAAICLPARQSNQAPHLNWRSCRVIWLSPAAFELSCVKPNEDHRVIVSDVISPKCKLFHRLKTYLFSFFQVDNSFFLFLWIFLKIIIKKSA